MTKLLIMWCLVLILLSASSDAEEARDVTETEIKLLTDIFPNNCHFSGQFLQRKHITGLPVPLLSDGDFFFSCDLGLVWHTLSPFSEAILYANLSKNYRVDDQGTMHKLSGIAQYIMSKVLVRLLKADAHYFAEEFLVTPSSNGQIIELRPDSYFLQKGIDNIQFKKTESLEDGLSLTVVVTDLTGQKTEVDIHKVKEHEIDGKASALEQCRNLYPETLGWCKTLHAPRRLNKKF